MDDKLEMGFCQAILFAAFRCSCGKLCAMGDQPNGNAVAIHEQPFCGRFIAIGDQSQALAYFKSLQQVPLTDEIKQTLERSAQAN